MTPNHSFSASALVFSAGLTFGSVARAQQQVASLDQATEPPAAAVAAAQGSASGAAPTASSQRDVAAPEPENANEASRSMDNAVSVFGVLGYGYSGLGSAPGVGARYQKRLVRDVSFHGPKIHDDIGLEAGLDFVHYSWSLPGYAQYDWSYDQFSVVAGVVWNVWIGDKFAVYPKVELAYGFGTASSYAGIASPGYDGLWFQGAAGAVYKVGSIALRGEAGWRALRLGAGVAF